VFTDVIDVDVIDVVCLSVYCLGGLGFCEIRDM
jgi:hypothetical protein